MYKYSFALLAWHLRLTAFRNFHSSRYTQKTHYEVLNVARNSSNKEIKEAFIKLSKKFHPDINKNKPDTHNEFVKVNEAYSILSRPEKRWEYDLSLRVAHPLASSAAPYVYENDVQKDPWKDPSFFKNRDHTKDEENHNKPYYGIGRLGRLPNSFLVAFLFTITAVGIAIQAIAIRHSMTLRRGALDEASARRSMLHTSLQEEAHDAGNLNNLRRIHSRLGGTSAGFDLLMKDKKQESGEVQQGEKASSPIKVVDELPTVDAKAVSIS